jgi:hypothetical protein
MSGKKAKAASPKKQKKEEEKEEKEEEPEEEGGDEDLNKLTVKQITSRSAVPSAGSTAITVPPSANRVGGVRFFRFFFFFLRVAVALLRCLPSAVFLQSLARP